MPPINRHRLRWPDWRRNALQNSLQNWLNGGLLAALLLVCGPAAAASVVCHVDYGGETRHITPTPNADRHTATGFPVGSFFRFRILDRRTPPALSGIKIYVYGEHPDGPRILHQASHPWPSRAGGSRGFTGLISVYEPMRDSELRYWCEVR